MTPAAGAALGRRAEGCDSRPESRNDRRGRHGSHLQGERAGRGIPLHGPYGVLRLGVRRRAADDDVQRSAQGRTRHCGAHPGLGRQRVDQTKKASSRSRAALRHALIQDFSVREPRIAALSLDPHAGDGGLIGQEEEQIIAPAIQAAFAETDSRVRAFPRRRILRRRGLSGNTTPYW